ELPAGYGYGAVVGNRLTVGAGVRTVVAAEASRDIIVATKGRRSDSPGLQPVKRRDGASLALGVVSRPGACANTTFPNNKKLVGLIEHSPTDTGVHRGSFMPQIRQHACSSPQKAQV